MLNGSRTVREPAVGDAGGQDGHQRAVVEAHDGEGVSRALPYRGAVGWGYQRRGNPPRPGRKQGDHVLYYISNDQAPNNVRKG